MQSLPEGFINAVEGVDFDYTDRQGLNPSTRVALNSLLFMPITSLIPGQDTGMDIDLIEETSINRLILLKIYVISGHCAEH